MKKNEVRIFMKDFLEEFGFCVFDATMSETFDGVFDEYWKIHGCPRSTKGRPTGGK